MTMETRSRHGRRQKDDKKDANYPSLEHSDAWDCYYMSGV